MFSPIGISEGNSQSFQNTSFQGFKKSAEDSFCDKWIKIAREMWGDSIEKPMKTRERWKVPKRLGPEGYVSKIFVITRLHT